MSFRLRPATPSGPSPAPPIALPGDSLCGYRIVRKLGDGPRAEVYLGFAESSRDEEAPETVALKICRTAARTTATTELEALARVDNPHVVRFIDAATAPSGMPVLVLERLQRGSLAHLLERREVLGAGEAVTILAPISAATDAVHASGVVHGSIGGGAVLFRQSGAPVLARFGRATLLESGLTPALLGPLVTVDRASLAALVALVLSRVEGADASLLAEWARGHVEDDGYGEGLAGRLFDFADPAPVRFESGVPVNSPVPGRLGAVSAGPLLATSPGGRNSNRSSGTAVLQGLSARALRIAHSLRVVRTPIWVAAASVLVAIIAAITLIPSGTDDAPAGTASPSPPAASGSSSATAVAAVDDPIRALVALIVQREGCLADLSVLCLEEIDQDGSAALSDDAALIRGIRAGGELPDVSALADGDDPHLVERLGDSALVDLGRDSKPASVLMIRTDAGWRIRDYLD